MVLPGCEAISHRQRVDPRNYGWRATDQTDERGTGDPVALAKWTQKWSDFLEFEVFPVLDDKQIAVVLGA